MIEDSEFQRFKSIMKRCGKDHDYALEIFTEFFGKKHDPNELDETGIIVVSNEE